jgi:hypothetical protein
MILIEKLKCNKGEDRGEFERKVRNISQLLQINPNWLMMLMFFESGLNAQAVNKQPGDPTDPYARAAKRATGLIQFMPSTARAHGTTTQQLYRMTAVDQLDYVYKYFQNRSEKIHSFYDLYLLTFFPAALGKQDNWIVQTSGIPASVIASQNKGFDLNKDHQITVGEIKQKLRAAVPASLLPQVFSDNEEKKSGN